MLMLVASEGELISWLKIKGRVKEGSDLFRHRHSSYCSIRYTILQFSRLKGNYNRDVDKDE